MAEPTERQRENLETTQAAFARFRPDNLDATLEWAHPEIETHISPKLANAGDYHGHEGFFASAGRWIETFDDYEIEVLGLDPIGERHVVARCHQSGTGRGSGVPVEMDIAYLVELRDGKFAALRLYATPEEAIEVGREREGIG